MAARSLNLVQLIGNLTRDPELRYTSSGTAVVSFGLATNKSWKNQEGNVEESTEFFNLVAWNKMAEICSQLLAKGMKIYVQGSLTTRSWTDDAGVTRYKTEVRVDDMILLDDKGRKGTGGTGTKSDDINEGGKGADEQVLEEEETKNAGDPLEDLPF